MKFIKTIGSTMYFLASGRYDAKKGGYVLDKNSSQQLIVEKDQLTGRVMDMKMPIRGLSIYESVDVFAKHINAHASAIKPKQKQNDVVTTTTNADILGRIAREEARLSALKKAAGVATTVTVPVPTDTPSKEDPVEAELSREKALEK